MYKIVMTSWGGIRRDMFTDLTYQNALELCESYDWVACPDMYGILRLRRCNHGLERENAARHEASL